MPPPESFQPKFEVVSCFFEFAAEILLLRRQDHKPEGNTWGVPAGKIHDKESPLEAIRREVREETGYTAEEKDFQYSHLLSVRYPDYDFTYHIYSLVLNARPTIRIRFAEHKESRWVFPFVALKMELIRDLDEYIKLFYGL